MRLSPRSKHVLNYYIFIQAGDKSNDTSLHENSEKFPLMIDEPGDETSQTSE